MLGTELVSFRRASRVLIDDPCIQSLNDKTGDKSGYLLNLWHSWQNYLLTLRRDKTEAGVPEENLWRSHHSPSRAASGTTCPICWPQIPCSSLTPTPMVSCSLSTIPPEDKRHCGWEPWIKAVIYRCQFGGTFFLLIHEVLFSIPTAVHKSLNASRN